MEPSDNSNSNGFVQVSIVDESNNQQPPQNEVNSDYSNNYSQSPPQSDGNGESSSYQPPPSATMSPTITCSNCNFANNPNTASCTQCGFSFQIMPSPPAPSAPSYSPQNSPPPATTTMGNGHAGAVNTGYDMEPVLGQTSNIPQPPQQSQYETTQTAQQPQYVHQYTQYTANNSSHLTPPTDDRYKPEEGLFGNFFIRTVYFSTTLFFVTLLSFSLWFTWRTDEHFEASYALCATGALMIFLGSFVSIIYVSLLRKNPDWQYSNMLQIVCIVIYALGAFFYFIGGCALTAAYNTHAVVDNVTAFSGLWFCEIIYVSAQTIIAAIDLRKRFMNVHGLRLLVLSCTMLALSVIMFFCCAVWSSTEGVNDITAGWSVEATGYFFMMIVIPSFIALKVCLDPSNSKQAIFDLVIAISLTISILLAVFGYFTLAGDANKNFVGYNEMASYWVGFGFYLLFIGVLITIDIKFEKYIKCYHKEEENNQPQQNVNGDGMNYSLMQQKNDELF